MELKLVRGVAADLAPADKRGRVTCRVGPLAVRLHRDLSTAAKAGDEVLIGGELHDTVVHAYALKNFTQLKKLSKVDYTFHILGGGFGGVIASFGLIFLSQPTVDKYFGNPVFDVALVAIGFAAAYYALHRIPRINRLTRWVDEVKE